MTKWVCWNYESGFYIIDARHKDDAVLKCEMDQPIGMEVALLGEEEEIKENMWALLDVKSLHKGIRQDTLRYCVKHRVTGEMLLKQIDERFEKWKRHTGLT